MVNVKTVPVGVYEKNENVFKIDSFTFIIKENKKFEITMEDSSWDSFPRVAYLSEEQAGKLRDWLTEKLTENIMKEQISVTADEEPWDDTYEPEITQEMIDAGNRVLLVYKPSALSSPVEEIYKAMRDLEDD